MGRDLSQYGLRGHDIVIKGGPCGRGGCPYRDLPYAQRNIGNQFPACDAGELLNQCRLEERELVQPDAVVDQEIEFLVANLVGPGIRRDGFPNDRDPVST